LLAGTVRLALQRRQSAAVIGRYLSGGVFVGLGVLTAVYGERQK
jgi:threonine/homoserine/homoserine lactone efflux protein